jgi:hypothetical protein
MDIIHDVFGYCVGEHAPMIKTLVILPLVLFALLSTALADTFVLKTGERVEGTIESETGENFIVKLKDGSLMTISKAAVQDILSAKPSAPMKLPDIEDIGKDVGKDAGKAAPAPAPVSAAGEGKMGELATSFNKKLSDLDNAANSNDADAVKKIADELRTDFNKIKAIKAVKSEKSIADSVDVVNKKIDDMLAAISISDKNEITKYKNAVIMSWLPIFSWMRANASASVEPDVPAPEQPKPVASPDSVAAGENAGQNAPIVVEREDADKAPHIFSADADKTYEDEGRPGKFKFTTENLPANLLRSGNIAVCLFAIQFLFLFITSKLAKVEFSTGVNAVVAALICAVAFLLISCARVQFWGMEFTGVLQTSFIAANVVTLFFIPYIFKATAAEVVFFILMLIAESVVGFYAFQYLIEKAQVWG